MIGLGPSQRRSSRAEERPARGEEVIEVLHLARLICVADVEHHARRGMICAGPAAPAFVCDAIAFAGQAHAGPLVWQRPGRARGHDRAEALRVERQEPDAARSVRGAYVRPDVRLDEATHPGEVGEPGGADVEPEGDEPDPGHPVVLVDREPVRQHRLHDLGRIRPVHEAQAGPAVVLPRPDHGFRRVRTDGDIEVSGGRRGSVRELHGTPLACIPSLPHF